MSETAAGDKLEILIIDDNPDVAPMFDILNQTENLRAYVLESGIEALEYLETHEPDAVLVDLAMPILDGITCVEEIRRNESLHTSKKRVRLAFYTSHSLNEVVEDVMRETEVERIFHKPLDPFTLVEEVKKWLNCSENGKVASI